MKAVWEQKNDREDSFVDLPALEVPFFDHQNSEDAHAESDISYVGQTATAAAPPEEINLMESVSIKVGWVAFWLKSRIFSRFCVS